MDANERINQAKLVANDAVFEAVLVIGRELQSDEHMYMREHQFREIWKHIMSLNIISADEFGAAIGWTEEACRKISGWKAPWKVDYEGKYGIPESPSVKRNFCWIALDLIAAKLGPRTEEYPVRVVLREEYRAKFERASAVRPDDLSSLGEDMAKLLTMPDGRPWDTKLDDDDDYLEHVPLNARKSFAGQITESNDVIITFRDLVIQTEHSLKQRAQFGKVSLNGVKILLSQKGLHLGMVFD